MLMVVAFWWLGQQKSRPVGGRTSTCGARALRNDDGGEFEAHRRPFNRLAGDSSNTDVIAVATDLVSWPHHPGDKVVQDLVYRRWTKEEILGIAKNFGG
jgi:hypothetical protein